MRKQRNLLILILITGLFFSLNAKSYQPYPIIFAHGVGGNSKTWGVKPWESTDTIMEDSLITGSTYSRFLNLMQPYILVDDYLHNPGHPAYPNRDLLEVINFDDNRGSLDEDADYPGSFHGQGDELWHRIKGALDEYYGEGNWEDNNNAKVILVGHSMGGLAIRQALKEDVLLHDSLLISHIDKVITTGTPNLGSVWATPVVREWHLRVLYAWHPAFLPIWKAISKGFSLAKNWLKQQGWTPLSELLIYIDDLVESIAGSFPPLIKDFIKMSIGHLIFDELMTSLEPLTGLPGDGDRDMSFGSKFIRNCGSYGSEGDIQFHSLRSYGFFDSESPSRYPFPFGLTGHEMKTTWNLGCAIEAFYILGGFWNPKLWEWAIKGGTSLVYWQVWNNESDFVVNLGSQNLNNVSSTYKAMDTDPHWGVIHGEESEKWKHIRNVLESPPTLDSMLLTTRLEDSTVVDTSYITPDTIDTIIGNLDSVSVNFKLMDSYFLSQTDVKVNINGVSSGGINYPEETSLTARV